MVISEGSFFFPISMRKILNGRMNRVYSVFFETFPYWDSSGLFFPYSGHIEDTKSVEFASVAICSTLTPKMTGLHVTNSTSISFMCILK